MASYHFHGLAIESLSIKGTSEVQRLQEENTQLQEEIQYLHQLLAAWQPQPCTLCQLHSTSSGASSKGTRSRAVSSTSSKEAGNAVHAAIDRVFRQQQVLIAQQQRQLLALQVELSSREQVLLEADAVLAEANRRIAALAAWASQSAQQQPALQTQQQRPTAPGMNASAATSSRRLLSSSSQGSRPGTSLSGSSGAAPSAAGGSAGSCRVDAAAGSVQQVYGVVLEQCRSLLTWCRESQARIARSKAASAAQCRGQAATRTTSTSSAGSSRANSRAASSSGGGSKQQWQSPDECPPATAEDVAQQLEVTYAPAGGNGFLQPGHSLSLTAIACGQGWSALAAPAVQQLLQQLTCLAAPLATLALQLRSIILPALPWVQSSQLGAELPSSCAQLAQQAASAAVQLAQLCALLPATQSTLSAPAVTAARQARAQQAAAGADASAWALEARHQQSSAQAQAQQQEDSSEALLLDHEDKALLQEVAGLLQHSGRATAQHTHLHTTGAPAAGKHGAVSSSAQAVIMHLQQRLHVLCLKQRVLNEQLAFLAKCSAAQAKLMTRLATDVLQALSDALDAVEPPSIQQQHSKTLQLCSQLQRACLLAQQQQGDIGASSNDSLLSSAQHARSSSAASSSSTISRTVLTLLENNREVLEDLPKLLHSSSASALKSTATATVVAALSDFKAGLQP